RHYAGLRSRGWDDRESPLPTLLLLLHVRDLDALDRPRRGAERERGARVVGVHVHLQRGFVADHDERVPELLESGLEAVAIKPLALDHEDGAVAIAGGLEVHRVRSGGLARDLWRGRQSLARDRAGQTAEKLDEPRAARVDDPRLSQDVELVRRARDGLLPVPHELYEQLSERLRLRRAPLRLFGQLADDREHRS